MDIAAQEKKTNKRYLPHTLDTRVDAVNLCRYTHDIDFVLRRYHISKASLMRWNKQFDGTRESLLDKSHRPHSQHPNAHTEEELKWIRDYHRRMPNISICELYGKLLQEKGCRRHLAPCTGFLSVWATVERWNPPGKSPNTWDIMIHQQNWAKSGKWT